MTLSAVRCPAVVRDAEITDCTGTQRRQRRHPLQRFGSGNVRITDLEDPVGIARQSRRNPDKARQPYRTQPPGGKEVYISHVNSRYLGSDSERCRQANHPIARGRQSQEVGRAEIRAGSRVDLRIESSVLRPGVKIPARYRQLHVVTTKRADTRIRRLHAERQLAQLRETSILNVTSIRPQRDADRCSLIGEWRLRVVRLLTVAKAATEPACVVE